MPYKSKAQQGWAHTPAGTKALGGPSAVREWDAASRGKSLPAKVDTKAGGKHLQSYFKSKTAGGLK